MGKNIVPIILIVLAIGTYFTFTSGKIDEIKQVQVVNDGYKSAIKNADKLIDVRDEVLKSRDKITDEDIVRLDKMIPDNIDNVRLIIDVNGIAGRHGVTLRGVRTSAGDTKAAATPATGASRTTGVAALNPVTISFSVSTTYGNFIAFMQDIERSLRIMDISRISLNSTDNGIYDYSVEIKTYWLKK
jgi:Tfp pilus assembly protein PilO